MLVNKMQNRLIKDVYCGFHSKIPVCCILFYILIWGPLIKLNVKLNNYIKAAPFGYIPCFVCFLLKNQVKIKYCNDCEVCGKEFWLNED